MKSKNRIVKGFEKFNKRLYLVLGSLAPDRLKNYFGVLLKQSGEDIGPKIYIGASITFTILIAIACFNISRLILPIVESTIICGFGAGLALFWFIVRLYYNADKKAKNIEKSLPDVLQMISANMRAGMTLERAIVSCAWPELGYLGIEIKRISIRVQTGTPLTEALQELSKNVRSGTLQRSIRLLVEGYSLGGEMAKLLYDVGNNLRETIRLKEDIKSATIAYGIFIIFGSAVASPLLFSTTVYYATLMEELNLQSGAGEVDFEQLPETGSSGITKMGIGASGGKQSFTSQEINLMALLCIAITTLSSGILLGVIRNGKIIGGLKYSVLLLLFGYVMFFTGSFVLNFVVGSLMYV